MKVAVYWNLHKGMWSIKALEGERKNTVICHARRVQLRNVTPKVSAAGRERVRVTGRKNVHAYLTGELRAIDFSRPRFKEYDNRTGEAMHNAVRRGVTSPFALRFGSEAITYNPYKDEGFNYADTGEDYSGSKCVVCLMNRKVYTEGTPV